MKPIAIKVHRKSATLELEYDDGTFTLPAEFLRVYSPSAEVMGHGPGQEVLQHGKKHVTFSDLEPQGHYAVKLVFSDGHDSGIYTWDYLRALSLTMDKRWQNYLDRLDEAGYSREPQFIAVGR